MSKQFTTEEIEQAAAIIYPLTDIPDRTNPNYDFCINFNSLQEDRRIEWAKGAKWVLEAYKQPANAVEFAEWLLYTPDIFQLTGQFETKDFKYKGEKYTTAEMYDLFLSTTQNTNTEAK